MRNVFGIRKNTPRIQKYIMTLFADVHKCKIVIFLQDVRGLGFLSIFIDVGLNWSLLAEA